MAEMIAMLNGLGANCMAGNCMGAVPMSPEQEMLAARAGIIGSSQYNPRLAAAPMTPSIAAYMMQRDQIVSQQYSPNLAGAPTTVADAARAMRAASIVSQSYDTNLAGSPTTSMSVADQVRENVISSTQYNRRFAGVPANVPPSLPQRGGRFGQRRGIQQGLSVSAAATLQGGPWYSPESRLGSTVLNGLGGWWEDQSTTMKVAYGVGAAALAYFGYKKFVG